MVLISGATGTFGRAAVARLLACPVKKIIVFSRDEKKQWDMAQEIPDPRVRYFLGDVRDKDRLLRAFSGVDYIIHAAALKQVPTLEYNPMEAIKTNILGTANVIDCAIDQKVKKVILLSSDKAVNPINLYGATKLCAEKLMISASAYGGCRTLFSVVRYGNVIGSRGSVVECFTKQVASGTLTVTDPEMTRFWVEVDDVVAFALKCLMIMSGGEIFVPKLESKKVLDIAKTICEDCKIEYIGARPGEKLHEVLINRDESIYAEEFDDHFVIRRDKPPKKEPFNYSSSSLC